ncbi:MAG: Diguanylate cyclase, domain [Actinomycetota bacterium]|jgi:GGDEF domain-containing protein
MAFYDEGIYDPLTGLLAPLYFYESSNRLLSWANRTDRPTSLIAIHHQDLGDDELIKCATELNSELRGGDLLARMNEKTFVLHLIGDQLGAEQLIFRLRNLLKFNLEFKVTQIQPEEDLIAALTRLGV